MGALALTVLRVEPSASGGGSPGSSRACRGSLLAHALVVKKATKKEVHQHDGLDPSHPKAAGHHPGEGGELHQTAGGDHPPLTTNQGVPVSDDQNSLRVSARGPTLLEDFILREKITHFDHERIPERVVHARGTAAHGYFDLTRSLAEYTTEKVLTEVGVKTPVFTRFSTIVQAGGAGSVDTPRDVRGFAAVKLYTKEGNWDSGGQQHSGLLHSRRHQVPGPDPRREDGARSRLSAIGDGARHLLGLHLAHARSDAHGHVDHVGPHDSAFPPDDGRFRCSHLPAPRRRRRLDLREVPLAPKARAAIDALGRGGQDRRRGPGLPPARPVRGRHVRQAGGVGSRGAALHRGGGRWLSVRPPRCHQADPRGDGAAEGDRPDGARPLARQLLRRDRAGGVLPLAPRAGARLLE